MTGIGGALWIAWRRQRARLVAAAALLAVSVLWAWFERTTLLSGAGGAAAPACGDHPGGPACIADGARGLVRTVLYGPVRQFGNLGLLSILLPALVGAFWGAPLPARTYETGRYALVFTQGAGRMRGFGADLAVAAAGTVLTATGLALLFAWRWRPAAHSAVGRPWYNPVVLEGTGPGAVSAALLGLAVGVLAGLALRRTVPAMLAAVVVVEGLRDAVQACHSVFLPAHRFTVHDTRPRSLPGVLSYDGDWTITRPDGSGIPLWKCGGGSWPGGGSACMRAHGYTAWSYRGYGPGSYWTFQWFDTALHLTMVALAVVLAVQLLRHRRP